MSDVQTVVMDPPWNTDAGGGGKGAQNHYPLLSLSNIYRVVSMARPFMEVSHHAHLYVWTTCAALPEAMTLIQMLGFRYVTDWIWLKRHIGLGQYRRSKHEQLLLARRGQIERIGQWPSSVFTEPETEHSVKPEESYRCIETVSPGPRLEMFARRPREGWTSWGNELPAAVSHG